MIFFQKLFRQLTYYATKLYIYKKKTIRDHIVLISSTPMARSYNFDYSINF